MEFAETPDDVWISIFECITSPAQLAALMLTCRRFYFLASTLLLRDLRWTNNKSTQRNLEAWTGVYPNLTSLPRTLTLKVPFDFGFGHRGVWGYVSPDMRLYDMIHSRIASFTSLHEIILDGTTISPYTYSILGAVPTLRSLSMRDCSFVQLHTPFSSQANPQFFPSISPPHQPPPFPFATLHITHLSLHNPKSSFRNEYHPYHPIHLITASSLTSLSMTWTDSLARLYAHGNWNLNAVTELDVVVPFLTRNIVESLVDFVERCTLGPRIQLRIQERDLSEGDINEIRMQIPLAGVWNFEGPMQLHEPTPRLTHMVMTLPLSLSALLRSLEKLSPSLEMLEVRVNTWDIELLFAIRHLFPVIQSLVIRYGNGVFPVDFFVTLGADIIDNLPYLHTLKLINDTSCMPNDPNRRRRHTNLMSHFFYTHPLLHTNDSDDIDAGMKVDPKPTGAVSMLEHGDLKDYLIGWNRYCKGLRSIQLDGRTCWKRRWEGDQWAALGVDLDERGNDGICDFSDL